MIEISYSKVSNYLNCAAKVKFQLAGIKTPKSSAMLYGSAWHEVLEKSFKNEPVDIEKIVKSYFTGVPSLGDIGWDGTVTVGKKDWSVESTAEWMKDAVKLILGSGIHPHMSELRLEKQFPSFKLRGIIDAFIGNGIVDFKLTGGYYDPYKKRNVYDVDKTQAICYSLLSGGPTPFSFVVMFKEQVPRLEIIPVPEAEDKKYIDFVVSDILVLVARGIEQKVFPANPGYKFCDERWCPYWAYCIGRK